jgi:spermidine synthase
MRLAGRGLAALAVIGIAFAALAPGRVFALRYPAGSYLSTTRDPASGVVLEYAAWDPVARIEVTRIPVPDPRTAFYPAFLGTRPELHRRIERILTQNNNAFTYAFAYDGTRESLRGTEETIYAAAYEAAAAPRPRALVIGVGGGFDVLTALYYDASSVTGIEVNAATIDILTRVYRDFFGPWVRDPRVRLVYGDGRHALAASRERYDVIQLSGVDSASGTPAAAHVFSESYLYTAEAFDVFLAHLTEAGILNVMRPEHFPPREALRVVTTAVGALRRAGVRRPADHIVTLTTPSGHFTATLVKRTPFTPEEVARLARWSSRSPFFRISFAPGPAGEPRNVYQAFLALGDPRREQALLSAYPFQIAPVDDDRPFFFRYSDWSHLFSRDPLVLGTVPVMETAVTLLTALVGAAVAFGLWLPLRLLNARGLREPQAGRYGLFCAGIGLGYLAIEIALIQKFGLLLGHPNYALSVVLAALLLTTGLGSLHARRLLSALGTMRFVAFALAGVVLGEYFLALPRLGSLVALPFAVRVAIVFALVAPIGLCLGVFFPSALEQLKARSPAFVPWAWGLNGMFSVLAPVWAVGVSMTWGMSALLVGAVPIYLLASFALPEPPAPSVLPDLVV